VSSYVSSACTTAVVLGLSRQIADEISCINPTGLVPFSPKSNLTITSNAVLPYLSAGAKSSIEAVASTRTVQVNSAFRTVAQQYLLYRWYQTGRCGISIAARPGRSNHESGRALDLANYSSVSSSLTSRGWSRVAGDAVHFDHLASSDIRGQDVRAFQRLWNRNNPSDKISEDGAYGPQTEARLAKAPATGFALGASCGSKAFEAAAIDVASVDGPDLIEPGVRARYKLTLRNTSNVEWSGSATLTAPASTQLYDASWNSTATITTLGAPIGPGELGEVVFDVTTPAVTQETPIFEQLALSHAGTQLGTITLALTVVPALTEPTSGETHEDLHDDEHGEDADADEDGGYHAVTGGCAVGGDGGLGALALLLTVGLARRRRPGKS
jgi:hypothetical protein